MDFSDPRTILPQLGLREGMRVADFGVGTGHYALVASHIVGSSGMVFAIDLQQDLLARVMADFRSRGLMNIKSVWGNIEKIGGTTLRDSAADAGILANTLFQIDDKESLLKEIKRVIKPGGKLLVVDWSGSYSGLGPSPDRVVSEFTAENLFISAGYHKEKTFRAGAHHYGFVFSV
jgi:ubiquinone/menaquinone biosynthesis C-methylase UbiE